MKNIIATILLLFAFSGFSQNVGQTGKDTAVWNYTDINKMKQGKWLKFDKKTKKKLYEGYFENDRPVGEFKRYHKNGKYSAIMFFEKNSTRIRAKFYYDNGNLAAEGIYSKENIKDSTWTFYGTDKALIARETYKNGVKHGKSLKFYRSKNKNGEPILSEELNYIDGKREGEWKQYFENGSIKLKTSYKKDMVDGYYTFNLETGSVYCMGNYRKGLKEGEWYYWNEPGKKTIIHFKKGIPDNQKEYSKIIDKELKEAEKNKNKIKEPDQMMNSPEKYFMGE